MLSKEKKIEYGFNTIDQRKALWIDIRTLATQYTKPWLVWGDFNALLHDQDRLYDALVTRLKLRTSLNVCKTCY